jgi:hypothetical protein
VSDQPTVKSIIADYLRAEGYDGLCDVDCGCWLTDLMPCGNLPADCKPGYDDEAGEEESSYFEPGERIIRPGRRE